MPDPKRHPERDLRDELLSLTPFDPEDAVAAFLEIEPERDDGDETDEERVSDA